jgi:hypothetical protein
MADKFKTNWLAVLSLALWAVILTIIVTFLDPRSSTEYPYSRSINSLIAIKFGAVLGLFTVGWAISHLVRSFKKEDPPAQHYRRWAAIQAIMAFFMWFGLTH